MRIVASIILSTIFHFSAFACTCAPPTFCEYSLSLVDDESALVFRGKYIQEQQIENGFIATQFFVEEIYRGEIVTPDSPLYTDEEFVNTPSTVWIFAGFDPACFRYFDDSDAVFAVQYNSEFISPDESLGYVPTICLPDYFAISETNTVTGYFKSGEGETTIDLEDLEKLIVDRCNINSVDAPVPLAKQAIIFPQPTSDQINIQWRDDETGWQVLLLDATGRVIKKVIGSSMDASELAEGLYFLKFSKEGRSYVKRLFKI